MNKSNLTYAMKAPAVGVQELKQIQEIDAEGI